MNSGKSVSISNTSNENYKYIIKDSNDIIVGRFVIIDLDEENKNVIIKLKFYKSSYELGGVLQDALKLILDKLVRGKGVHKVNIICDERIALTPFNNLGFQLEGYISDSSIVSSRYEGSLMFGIVEEEYYGNVHKRDLTIKGERICIKVLNSENAEELLEYYLRNKIFLTRFEPHREESFYTLETQRQSLMENYREFLKDEGTHFGIYIEEKLIGRIRISNIVQGVFKSAFIGYSMDEKHQGKGYMKEAVNLVLQYAYNDLGLHRIEATTLVDNKRSQGVLRGCDFLELGICKDYLHINGKWKDHIIFYKNRS